MAFIFKQFKFGLLILVIAASPVQSAIALDFDQNEHAMLMDCQPAPMQSDDVVDQQVTESCQSNQESVCVNGIHLGCIAQFSSSMFQKFYIFSASSITARRLKFGIDIESLTTHYPDRIIRPPRV